MVRLNSEITQFRVTIATNCRKLILVFCMSASYVVDYERASRLLFQCVVSIQCVLIISPVNRTKVYVINGYGCYTNIYIISLFYVSLLHSVN
jgi:uncharacterized membrane protein